MSSRRRWDPCAVFLSAEPIVVLKFGVGFMETGFSAWNCLVALQDGGAAQLGKFGLEIKRCWSFPDGFPAFSSFSARLLVENREFCLALVGK